VTSLAPQDGYKCFPTIVVVASFPIANHCIRSIISFCNHTLHFYFDTEDVQEGHLNLLLAAQLLWLLCEQPPCELLLPTGELFLADTPSQQSYRPASSGEATWTAFLDIHLYTKHRASMCSYVVFKRDCGHREHHIRQICTRPWGCNKGIVRMASLIGQCSWCLDRRREQALQRRWLPGTGGGSWT